MALRMLLLIDENVPRSVAGFFVSRGHDVRLVLDLFPAGTPDPVIASIGDRMAALIVTWDRDFETIVSRLPEGNRTKFRRLGRISFKCAEPRGAALLAQWIDMIEMYYAQCKERGEGRLIMQIQESGLKLT